MEIYRITNKITNDFYIGSAINFKNRKWSHVSSLRKNKHKNQFIQNSWNKYGENAFIFEIVEVVDKKENLIIQEQYWMDTLSPTFNLAKVAGSPLGVKHTEKSRKNMSLAHIGLTEEERGHKEDCNCPICNPQSGENSPRYKPREERFCVCGCGKSFVCINTSKKRFISGHNKSQLGRKKTKEEIEKQRNKILIPILQYDLNNNFIREWDGIITAANTLKINNSAIWCCLNEKTKTSGKFIWKYKFKT
ncbi:MAG: hypothetical protein DRN27_05815 [Thermoplasmata archaeon]|nr:MAG: hypothetical protein DRN27_05815 [Thermoplasmata archaeon]